MLLTNLCWTDGHYTLAVLESDGRPEKHKILLHIGCKHGKINDILKKKGFAVLPAPVLSTTNHAMQKQLVKVNVYFRVLFYLSHPISFPD